MDAEVEAKKAWLGVDGTEAAPKAGSTLELYKKASAYRAKATADGKATLDLYNDKVAEIAAAHILIESAPTSDNANRQAQRDNYHLWASAKTLEAR